MYKFFSYALFILPVSIALFVIIGAKSEAIGKVGVPLVLVTVLLYIVFPLALLLRGILQVRQDTLLKRLLDKINGVRFPFKLNTELGAGLLKIFLVFFSILVAAEIVVVFMSKVIFSFYAYEAGMAVDAFKNAKTYRSDVINIKSKLDALEKKMYEEKQADFFADNDRVYTYASPSISYVLKNISIESESYGFNNRYVYQLSFCFKGSFWSELGSGNESQDPEQDVCSYPSTGGSDEPQKSLMLGWEYYLSQKEVITDFYAREYYVEDYNLPVIVATLETVDRSLTYIMYPAKYDMLYPGYKRIALYSAIDLKYNRSDTCSLSSKGTDEITFKCTAEYKDPQSDGSPVPATDTYYTISETSAGDLQHTQKPDSVG